MIPCCRCCFPSAAHRLSVRLQDFRRGQQLIVERDFAQLRQFFQASRSVLTRGVRQLGGLGSWRFALLWTLMLCSPASSSRQAAGVVTSWELVLLWIVALPVQLPSKLPAGCGWAYRRLLQLEQQCLWSCVCRRDWPTHRPGICHFPSLPAGLL